MLRSVLRGLRHIKIAKIKIKERNLQTAVINPLSSKSEVYLVDEDSNGNNNACDKKSAVNKFTNRTYTCGDLTLDHVGENVILCGWLEFQRMNKFIVLRDGYGQTQLIIKDNDTVNQQLMNSISFESIIEAKGVVVSRPKEMRNAKQTTGDVEVLIDSIKVLNKAKMTLPFNIREFQKAKESLRMQFRYLDLRFPLMQRNLRERSKMLMKMREFLVNRCGFVDVETPTLFKATPGGAQEFIVPTRFPGQFYSLVQSPQQFKQMLMAGAIDRYFQIARCYRDEGARPDRQPEFTQLDIEMSFTSLEHILDLIEDLLKFSLPQFVGEVSKYPRISYKNAMELYGSDQPDIRMDFKLQDCSRVLEENSKLSGNCKDFGAYCLIFPSEYANLNKSVKSSLEELARKYPKTKLVQSKVKDGQDWVSKISKLLGEQVAEKFRSVVDLPNDCVLFLGFGDKLQTLNLLGKVRVQYVDFLESLGISIQKQGMHLLWVVDFPLFESGDSGELTSAHHPFTAPNPDDLHLLEKSPLDVRALSYDLVLNGNEIGGGSIRIHEAELQEKVFDMLKIDKSSMSHILEMLASGCPPHGGIALGLDRLMSKILCTSSIRDVIAFPKSFEGRDPLSGAPSKVSEKEQKLYHIKTVDT